MRLSDCIIGKTYVEIDSGFGTYFQVIRDATDEERATEIMDDLMPADAVLRLVKIVTPGEKSRTRWFQETPTIGMGCLCIEEVE